MSNPLVAETFRDLPYALREQVLSYAETVRLAMPSIAHDISRENSRALEDHVIFFSSVRKLFSIVSSAYWSLDNTSKILSESDISTITIAGQSFSRGSEAYSQLHSLLKDLEESLAQTDSLELIRLPFKDMAESIADELG